jgi:hypothetical protein
MFRLVQHRPARPLWDFPLPPDAPDDYQLTSVATRKNSRYRCQKSVEIHVQEVASFWGTVADLSLFWRMLRPDTDSSGTGEEVESGNMVRPKQSRADARVTHTVPASESAEFTQISEADLDQIRRFLESVSPLSRKTRWPVVPLRTRI